MKIPFFHYTNIDNLSNIIKNTRLLSRNGLIQKRAKFTDVSIDPIQSVRQKLGLLNYIPLFAGFYKKFGSYELNVYLKKKNYLPIIQNKSFYGTLNKTLQTKMGNSYENIIIFLVNNELISKFADQGKVRFFTNIAIKKEAVELSVNNRDDLQNLIKEGIKDEGVSIEIDIFDDGKASIECMSDIEVIIVDNDRIKTKVENIITKYNTQRTNPLIIVTNLPRKPVLTWSPRKVPTEKQVAFAKYVEGLKQKGLTGEKYREKITQWQRMQKAS